MASKESVNKPDFTLIPLTIYHTHAGKNEDENFALATMVQVEAWYGGSKLHQLPSIRERVIEYYLRNHSLHQMLTEVAKVMEFGAIKYARENWALGTKYSKLIAATERHLMAWTEDATDKESGCNHLAHVLCNLGFLLHYQSLDDSFRKEIDDRSLIYSEIR